MRSIFLLIALSLPLALAGCRSAPPPPDDSGVHVRAPFVSVDVPR